MGEGGLGWGMEEVGEEEVEGCAYGEIGGGSGYAGLGGTRLRMGTPSTSFPSALTMKYAFDIHAKPIK